MKGERDERALSREISALTAEICGYRQERKAEFDWLRSQCGLATKQDLEQILDLLRRILGCKKQEQKGLFMLTVGLDEPITKENMEVTWAKPIKPGFRRPFTLTPDEAVDVRGDGSFAGWEAVEGDSTALIKPESTAKSIQGYINGDGALGAKRIRLKVDGHVGDGDVEITLDVLFQVASADATTLTVAEGVDEPIPGV